MLPKSPKSLGRAPPPFAGLPLALRGLVRRTWEGSVVVAMRTPPCSRMHHLAPPVSYFIAVETGLWQRLNYAVIKCN